jgi:hypothetical protein
MDMNTSNPPLLDPDQLPPPPQTAKAFKPQMVPYHTTKPLTTQEEHPAKLTR